VQLDEAMVKERESFNEEKKTFVNSLVCMCSIVNNLCDGMCTVSINRLL